MYVHIAGHSNYHLKAVLDDAPPCAFLWSYYAIRKLTRHVHMIRREGQHRPFIVDSGVFSFLGQLRKAGYEQNYMKEFIATLPDWIEEYLTWVRENRSWIKVMAEIDLQDIVGEEQVWKWREEYFFPFQKETGVSVMFTWRNTGALEEAQKLLADDRCGYYAFGGKDATPGRQTVRERRAFSLEAYRKGRPVHGFAQVGKKLLEKIPFASVDSTSWSSSDRFGAVHGWNPRTGMTTTTKAKFKEFAQQGASRELAGKQGGHFPFYGKEKEERYGAFAENIKSHLMLQSRYTALWKRRGVDWGPALRNIYEEKYVPEEVAAL